jgi:hypothetical protein
LNEYFVKHFKVLSAGKESVSKEKQGSNKMRSLYSMCDVIFAFRFVLSGHLLSGVRSFFSLLLPHQLLKSTN